MVSSRPKQFRAPGGGAATGARRGPVALALRLRAHPYVATLVGATIEVLFAIAFSHLSHHAILGLVGAEAAVVGLAVAVLAGPWPGVVTTTAGAITFWVFIVDRGQTAPTIATVVAACLWGLSAFAAGAIADELRRQVAARRRADESRAELHRRLETALLPTLPTLPDGYRAATIYRPGDERLGLGGDFYDLQTVDGGGLALLIGDVSGHGPRSAALGAALRTSWRSLIQAGVDGPLLVEALTRIAQSEKAGDELFSTLWLGWLDAPGTTLRMGSLGHPPPLLLADEVRFLESPPLPALDIGAPIEWSPSQVHLPTTWTLLLYTDGLIEGRAAAGATERFGYERLRQWFAAQGSRLVDGACLRRLLSALEDAHGGPLPDDVAVVALTRLVSAQQ